MSSASGLEKCTALKYLCQVPIAACVCASGGASRARRDEHALWRPRDATAFPSRRWPWQRTVRPMCVPPAARRERGGTSPHCAAPATRPPSPAGAGGERVPCGRCVCRRRRVASVAGRAPARRDSLPQPALVEGARRAAHVCAAGGASRTTIARLSHPHNPNVSNGLNLA